MLKARCMIRELFHRKKEKCPRGGTNLTEMQGPRKMYVAPATVIDDDDDDEEESDDSAEECKKRDVEKGSLVELVKQRSISHQMVNFRLQFNLFD